MFRILPLALAILPASAFAQTTHTVPGSHATIQQAISASSSGDTVLVSPGVYYEQIDFLGRHITVRGVGGPAVTVIDGRRSGTVVTFETSEGSSAILQGFTVRNGRGVGGGPGGVMCLASAPTLLDCWFIDNEGRVGSAGAVDSRGGSQPRAVGCLFEGNVGGGDSTYSGAGAIRCWNGSSVTAEDCVFVGNHGGGHWDPRAGPGAIQGAGTGASITLRRCVFEGNRGGPTGGAPSGDGGAGAIRVLSSAELTVEHCNFIANVGGEGIAGYAEGGSGAITSSSNVTSYIRSSAFLDNVGGGALASDYGYGGAGAISVTSGCSHQCSPPDMTVTDTRFARNRGGSGNYRSGPGAIYTSSNTAPLFKHCTIRDNEGGAGTPEGGDHAGSGAMQAQSNTNPRFEECLIEGNRGGHGGAGGVDYAGSGAFDVSSSATIVLVNSVIARNVGGSGGVGPGAPTQAGDRGGSGAMSVTSNATATITNCTIVLNQGGDPYVSGHGIGGLFLDDGGQVTNSIIWGNTSSHTAHDFVGSASISYCCFSSADGSGGGSHGGTTDGFGNNNFLAEPKLVDPLGGDYGLRCDSPCIEAGTTLAAELPEVDLDGDPRIWGERPDIGADELRTSRMGVNGCVAALNSDGAGAAIVAFGEPRLGGDCFALRADDVTGPGGFLYGQTPVQVTFGNGFRCIGGQVFRLPPVTPTGASLHADVDPAQLAGPITPGSTWYFQAWYRDVAAGGAGFNLTDSVEIVFVP